MPGGWAVILGDGQPLHGLDGPVQVWHFPCIALEMLKLHAVDSFNTTRLLNFGRAVAAILPLLMAAASTDKSPWQVGNPTVQEMLRPREHQKCYTRAI